MVAPAEGFAKPENNVGQFLHGPATACVPAAPLRKKPLIRRKLVPANVAACGIGAAATRMWTQTTYVTPRHVACEQGKSTATRATDCGLAVLAAVNCSTPDAEQAAPAMVTHYKDGVHISPLQGETTVTAHGRALLQFCMDSGAEFLSGRTTSAPTSTAVSG